MGAGPMKIKGIAERTKGIASAARFCTNPILTLESRLIEITSEKKRIKAGHAPDGVREIASINARVKMIFTLASSL